MDPKLIFFFAMGFAQYAMTLGCPGCALHKDPNDPSLQKYLAETLSSYKTAPTGTENEHIELVKVKKASVQVVSGVKYTYDFDAKGLKSHNLYECHLTVLMRAWAGEKKVLEYTCQKNLNPENLHSSDVDKVIKSSQKYCAGCVVEISNTDAAANQFLKRTLFNINKSSDSTKVWKLNKTNKVQMQIVAGLKYKIEFEAEDETKSVHICNAVIVLQPWHDKEPSVTHFECSPLSQRH